MEFKVEKKSVRVKIDDKSYDMKVPSVMQHVQIQKDIAEAKTEDSIEIMAKYMENLGLPRDVINSLDSESFLDLYTFIHSPKKNSMPAV